MRETGDIRLKKINPDEVDWRHGEVGGNSKYWKIYEAIRKLKIGEAIVVELEKEAYFAAALCSAFKKDRANNSDFAITVRNVTQGPHKPQMGTHWAVMRVLPKQQNEQGR